MRLFYTRNAFFKAAHEGDAKTVAEFTRKSNTWTKERDENGDTAAHIAARKNHAPVIKALHEAHRLSMQETDKDGNTALHIALQEKNEDLACDIYSRDNYCASLTNEAGENALHVAATYGMARFLSIHGIYGYLFKEKDKLGDTVLHKAVKANMPNIADQIMSKDVFGINATNNDQKTALHLAAEIGDALMVRTLLQAKYCGVGEKDLVQETPLHKALQNDHEEVALLLLGHRDASIIASWPDSTRNTPAHIAVAKGLFEVVDRLIALDRTVMQRPDGEGVTPLQIAVKRGDIDILNKLLPLPGFAAALKANEKIFPTILRQALETDCVDILKILMESGKADMSRGPAIYVAAAAGSIKCLNLLIASGVDVHAVNTVNLEEREEDGFNYDFDYNRIPRYVTRYYKVTKTPLVAAIENGHTTAALTLLEAGVRPDQFAHSGKTNEYRYPLHMAIRKNNPAIVYALIEKGAPKQQMEDSKYPIDLARQFALSDIINMLEANIPYRAPVKKVMPALVPPNPIVMPQPAATAPAPEKMNQWIKLNAHEIANVRHYPVLNRRLMDIFNFERCERIIITHNAGDKIEGVSMAEKFENMGEETLFSAIDEFEKQGGKVDRARVLKNRGIMIKKAV